MSGQAGDWTRQWYREQVAASEVRLGVTYSPPVAPGLLMAVCSCPAGRLPIGHVWYQWAADGAIEIVYSWVEPRARKLGVRRRIDEAMRAAYPETPMRTAGTSGEAATAFLRSADFQQRSGGWWERTP